MTTAFEQTRAERFFERGDLLAERGLAEMQRIGGAAEVAQVRNGQERTEQPEFLFDSLG